MIVSYFHINYYNALTLTNCPCTSCNVTWTLTSRGLYCLGSNGLFSLTVIFTYSDALSPFEYLS